MSSATTVLGEKRRQPRSAVHLPVRFATEGGSGGGIFGWTVDVSPLGALVECPASEVPRFPSDARRGNLWIASHTDPEGHSLSLGTARVVRMRHDGSLVRLAVEFTHPADSDLFAAQFVGVSDAARSVRSHIRRAAQCEYNVLVTGETGSGKNLVAECIHRHSRGPNAPFVRVNCPGIPESLFESELFGHEKGAFTDAKSATPGLFRIAGEGTILLDEISEMSVALQAKLLRVLDEKVFVPVGGREAVPVRCRIVAASNADLAERMRKGLLRQDLYYRLNEAPIAVPALRERREDIAVLADHLARKHASILGQAPRRLKAERARDLSQRDWPGNVRELDNWIKQWLLGFRSAGGSQDESTEAAVSPDGIAAEIAEAIHRHSGSLDALKQNIMDVAERESLRAALHQNRGCRTRAAKALGISYRTILRKIERHNLA